MFNIQLEPNAALANGSNKTLPSTTLVEWPVLLPNLPLLHLVDGLGSNLSSPLLIVSRATRSSFRLRWQ